MRTSPQIGQIDDDDDFGNFVNPLITVKSFFVFSTNWLLIPSESHSYIHLYRFLSQTAHQFC